MTELDQSALHDALFTAIRGEIDDSLSFISGCKQLPRGQRKPRVGSSVRDYLADQIARKVAGHIADQFVMLDLIQEFIDMDDRECVPDTWECGTHAYPTGETGTPCPHTQARSLLKAHGAELSARKAARSKAAVDDLMAALDRIDPLRGIRQRDVDAVAEWETRAHD